MPSHTITLPALYPKQKQAFFCEERYSVTEACTKAGKTVGALAWQLDRVASDSMAREHWWVAPVYGQAMIAFKRAKRMLSAMIVAGLATATVSGGETTVPTIRMANGASWQFRSAKDADNLYGEDVASAVFDEYTRASEESWVALRSTLTHTGGPVRLIGNVRGRGWGYKLARAAEAGEPGMRHTRITADDAIEAGIMSRAEVDDAKRAITLASGREAFRELYYCEPSDDGGNPFGLKAIADCCVPGLASGDPVVWGVDLAQKVDFTVAIGLNAQGAVCRFERWNRLSWAVQRERLISLIGNTPAWIDSTGVGAPVVEDIRAECRKAEGYQFTTKSKQELMGRLAVAIQSGEIRVPDGPVRSELEMFEYEVRGTNVLYAAPSGYHDDCVCALALAVYGMGELGKKPVSWVPETTFSAPARTGRGWRATA